MFRRNNNNKKDDKENGGGSGSREPVLTRTLSQEITHLKSRERQFEEHVQQKQQQRSAVTSLLVQHHSQSSQTDPSPRDSEGHLSLGEGGSASPSPDDRGTLSSEGRSTSPNGGAAGSFSPYRNAGVLRNAYGSYLSELSELDDADMPPDAKREAKDKEILRVMVADLLYSAARGRLQSVKKKVKALESRGMLISDPSCCDYDKRTPLHLAAADGSFRVTEWLLKEKRANPNCIDRFGQTPLQGAIHGDHKMIVNLLIDHGGKVLEQGNLVEYKTMQSIGSFAELSSMSLQSSQGAKAAAGLGHSGQESLDASGGANGVDAALGTSALGVRRGSVNFALEDEFWEISADTVEKSSKLGAGEFGTVYKATWNETPVAMKVLKHSDNLAIGEFVTEMNMMRKLHHPNIVQFLGGCTKTKPYFIVTELSAAGSLADVFYMKQKLPLTRLLELAIDCATGMAYLHSSAIKKPATLHRDLKPANLMIFGTANAHLDKERSLELLVRSGTLKVTDFGLSKTLGDVAPKKSGANSYTLTGETGSYRYMAPEVYRHEDYNHKVDVYAYAMILYQMFEGRPPFVMLEPQQAAVAAAINGLRPKFTELKKPGSRQKLRNLVEQCWAADRDTRPDFKDTIPILHECLQDAIKEEKQAKKKWYQL
mmetsp:Transcript_2635/g.6192  ORF Transcript_2635/g.6192 Transcript_2635/m.6192 type:complete len:653 (+) Transcript_2635:298-2256(+)